MDLNNWNTVMQSTDVIKFNSRNTFIQLFVMSSKRVGHDGKKDVKIYCSSRHFKIIQGQKIFSTEEQQTSKIYNINPGNAFLNICINFDD